LPLKKFFRGRRVQATKRRGDRILVKLARQGLHDKPQWIALSPEQYSREVVVKFSPPRE
jgi:hypothetical protein